MDRPRMNVQPQESQARCYGEAERRLQPQRGTSPRLLDLDGAATYLSVSPWTIRDLDAAGVLPRVRELRKLLFDKADLDVLIDAWKDGASERRW